MKSDLDVLAVKREKLLELDYMRVIACFAVMIVHVSATGVTEYIHGSFPHIVMTLLNRSLKFTTPIFIFLSGVTGFYGYRNKEFNYFEFISKRLKNVLIPYLVWCVIYYFVYIKVGYYAFNIKFFVKSVLQGTMSYHLYFVIIITQLYLLGPIFYKLVKKSKNRIRLLVISAIITSLCVEYLRFDLSDRVFLKYMFFYMFGIFVTLENEKFTSWLKKYSVLATIGYIVVGLAYTLVSYYDMKIYSYVWFLFSTVSILFVYLVGLVSKEKLRKFYGLIKLFGQSSYYIYLMHPIILTTMIIMTADKGILSITTKLIIYFSVVIPVTVISCLLYTMVKNKIKSYRKRPLVVNN